MSNDDLVRCVRRATGEDAAAVADLFVRARERAVPAIPPLARPGEQARAWLVRSVVDGREVWVAESETGRVVGMMMLTEDWIDQLYVDPDLTGRGIGKSLLDVAKRCRPAGLQLWTFQSNHRAHRFYERHGFQPVERTDGSGNQERAPDVRYVWRPTGTTAEEREW